jgi:hypothetical protein
MRKPLHAALAASLLATAFVATPSFAQIKVNDQLSLTGFLDMSMTAALPDSGPKTAGAAFDQFELDFNYTFSDRFAARVDVNSLGGGSVDLEQAFISYRVIPEVKVGAGKFLSSSGWEAAEPTGMYQNSYSNAFVYGSYQNGVNVSYAVIPEVTLYAAFVDGIWVDDGDIRRPGLEGQVAYKPTAEITGKLTGMYEQEYGYGKTVVNAWASYITGPVTTAIEGDYLVNYAADGDNGYAYLAMVNYKFANGIAVTGRFSGIDTDLGPASRELTLSPSYNLADNWLILAEAKYQLDAKDIALALETTVTF